MTNKSVATLLSLMLSIVAVGCSESAPAPETGRYPEAERQSFLNGCADGTSLATCECMLAKIEQTIPLAELLELQALGDAVLKDDRVIAAVTACVN